MAKKLIEIKPYINEDKPKYILKAVVEDFDSYPYIGQPAEMREICIGSEEEFQNVLPIIEISKAFYKTEYYKIDNTVAMNIIKSFVVNNKIDNTDLLQWLSQYWFTATDFTIFKYDEVNKYYILYESEISEELEKLMVELTDKLKKYITDNNQEEDLSLQE